MPMFFTVSHVPIAMCFIFENEITKRICNFDGSLGLGQSEGRAATPIAGSGSRSDPDSGVRVAQRP